MSIFCCVLLKLRTLLQMLTSNQPCFPLMAILFSACFPNGTIEVTNPNTTLYTDVMAVQNQGLSSASKCDVTTSGSQIILTNCSEVGIITI